MKSLLISLSLYAVFFNFPFFANQMVNEIQIDDVVGLSDEPNSSLRQPIGFCSSSDKCHGHVNKFELRAGARFLPGVSHSELKIDKDVEELIKTLAV